MGGRVGHTQLRFKPQWLEARGVKQSRGESPAARQSVLNCT